MLLLVSLNHKLSLALFTSAIKYILRLIKLFFLFILKCLQRSDMEHQGWSFEENYSLSTNRRSIRYYLIIFDLMFSFIKKKTL